MNNCPCGSGEDLDNCCLKYISGKEKAPTAEKLMRSRFTAYVLKNVLYVINTTVFSNRIFLKKKEIEAWNNSIQWTKLEVLNFTENSVEFNAYYINEIGQLDCHHEKSKFKKVNNQWYYVDGLFDTP